MALTLEDLQEIAKIESDREAGFQYNINVCVAAGCISCQSALVKDALEKEVSRRGWETWCNVKGVGCLGLCAAGPLLACRARRESTIEGPLSRMSLKSSIHSVVPR